jgi:hypothetical protein
MNIFYLSRDPEEAASMHIWPKHTVKMILESAQLLSTAHHVLDGDGSGPYKKTHTNRPSAVWVRESALNYGYVYELMMALGEEYTAKTGKTHKTISDHADTLKLLPKNIPMIDFQDPPQCMPDEYKADDAVEGYHNYYEFKRDLLCN